MGFMTLSWGKITIWLERDASNFLYRITLPTDHTRLLLWMSVQQHSSTAFRTSNERRRENDNRAQHIRSIRAGLYVFLLVFFFSVGWLPTSLSALFSGCSPNASHSRSHGSDEEDIYTRCCIVWKASVPCALCRQCGLGAVVATAVIVVFVDIDTILGSYFISNAPAASAETIRHG